LIGGLVFLLQQSPRPDSPLREGAS